MDALLYENTGYRVNFFTVKLLFLIIKTDLWITIVSQFDKY